MSDEWTRVTDGVEFLHPTHPTDDVAIGGDTTEAPFYFDVDNYLKLVQRWLGIACTPTATTPTLKLRPTGTPGDPSYPLLLLQDQTQTNLAKWEASGSIDLIRKFLKNAGQITFQSEVEEETQYTSMFEKDGDFYFAVNAWWDAAAQRWKRRKKNSYAYLLVVWVKHGVDGGTPPPVGSAPTGPIWYRCEPQKLNGEYEEVINDNWQGLYGGETGLMVTQDRNLVLGGANLEVDGYGMPPHGRFIHVAVSKDESASRTVIQRNASYYGANQWGPDSPDKPCSALGFLDDGSLHYWYHEPTDVPFDTEDWVERMTLTAAGKLVLGTGTALRRLNVYDSAIAVSQFRSSNSLGTRLDIQTNSGSAASNAVLLVRNPDATGASWEVGLNCGGAGPLAKALCWSLSAGVDFSNILMSLSTGGVLNVTGSYQVGGVKVVGAQQAHIANADGTLEDITTKFNTLLERLEEHGLLAST